MKRGGGLKAPRALPPATPIKSRRLIASPEAQDWPWYRVKNERTGKDSALAQSMSALGHKRTYAVQQPMSALLSIATAKADFRRRSCLLYPRSGHVQCTRRCPLSAKADIR